MDSGIGAKFGFLVEGLPTLVLLSLCSCMSMPGILVPVSQGRRGRLESLGT